MKAASKLAHPTLFPSFLTKGNVQAKFLQNAHKLNAAFSFWGGTIMFVEIKLSHFGILDVHYQTWIEVSLGISISTLIIFSLKRSADFCLSCEVKRPGEFLPPPKLVTNTISLFHVGCEIFLTWHLWPSEYFWKFSRWTSLSPQRLSIILLKGCWAWHWLEGEATLFLL